MVWLSKISIILIGILFPFLSFASVSYNSGEGWPTYTKNGIGYGFVQDSLLYRYYGGQIFQANDNFSSDGVIIEGCTTKATTTSPIPEIELSIYSSETAPTYSEDLAGWTFENSWGAYIPFCENGDISEFQLSGLIYFDIRTINFVSGKYYAMVITDSAEHEEMKYTRTSPDTNALSICGDGNDFLCGGFVLNNSTSTYGLWMSFDGLAQAEAIYGACIISTFPYFDIQQCLSNAFIFLFVPDDTKVNDLTSISFASSTPFSYLYQMNGYLTTLKNGSATSTPKIVIYAPNTTVTIFSVASTTSIFGSGANTIKQFLSWIIWLVALFVAIFEIYYFIRRTE